MSTEKKILCDTCVNKFFCDEVRTRRCVNYIKGETKKKDYDLTLAAQGYYNKK